MKVEQEKVKVLYFGLINIGYIIMPSRRYSKRYFCNNFETQILDLAFGSLFNMGLIELTTYIRFNHTTHFLLVTTYLIFEYSL